MSKDQKIINLAKEIRAITESYNRAGLPMQDIISVLSLEKQRAILEFLK